MKFFKIFVGIGLAWTTPLVAQATEVQRAVSDKADWIKQTITATKTESDQSKPANAWKQTQPSLTAETPTSQPIVVAKAITQKVKIRPFMPHRPLPHRRDLELEQLKEQQAIPDQEPQKNLLGQVSAFVEGQNRSNNDIYAAQNRQLLPLPSAQPRNFRVAKSSINRGRTVAVRPVSNQSRLMQAPVAAAAQNSDAPPFGVLQQAEKFLLPSLPESQDQGDDPSVPPVITGTDNPATISSAGPPPFPLNLLPQDSLKRFIQGSAGRVKGVGPRPYFGCWHTNGQLGSATNIASAASGRNVYSNLPSAGFHSYVLGPGGSLGARYIRTNTVSYSYRSSRYADSQSHRSYATSASRPAAVDPRVSAYPPYLGQSSAH